MKKLRVGVVFGGRSGEHEVSLVSATSVIQALNRDKYEVVPIGITPEGRWLSSDRALGLLKAKGESSGEPEQFLVPEPNRRGLITAGGGGAPIPLDVVLPVMHGTYGEDGTLQGLLELADIPYVGAGVLGSAVGMDKIAQKQILKNAGFPVVRYLSFITSEVRLRPERAVGVIEKRLRYPVFAKPANTGSSVGITKAHNRKELRPALELAGSFDRRIIVEQGVRNVREIECAVLGNDAPESSLLGEIVPSNEFYDYEAKYVDGKSTAIIPASLPKRLSTTIRKMAIDAFRAIDCAGMARVDFFVTKGSGRIYLNELNTIPGFTSISMYPKLWEATGLPYPALLDRLIQLALERHRTKQGIRHAYTPPREWYRE